jgi:hypothetical protein
MSRMTPEEDREFREKIDGSPPGLTRRASEIKSRTIRWPWKGRFAVGYITLQTGEEGLGKSLFAAWLVARVSRGVLEGIWHGYPVDVLVVAGEDALEDTWKPRLELAEANFDLVHFLDLDELPTDWNVCDGIDKLRAAVQETKAKLVVFDAIMDHLPPAQGGENINSPTFVRGALKPLRGLVRGLGIVALISLHPPKARGTTFRELVQASQAFSAIPRVGLYFAWHPDEAEDDPERRRVIIRGKGNIGRNPGAIEFKVAERDHLHADGDIQGREVVYDVQPSDMTLSELLAKQRHAAAEGASKVDQAGEIIKGALSNHEWHSCPPVREKLEAAGLNHNQIVARAKKRAGVESRKKPGAPDGGWEWRIPPSDHEPDEALARAR